MLQVRLPERTVTGRFEGVDENGHLRLQQDDGVIAITAGEVFGFGDRS